MNLDLNDNEQSIASEIYSPELSDNYKKLFNTLVSRIGKAIPSNHIEIINDEMKKIVEKNDDLFNDIEMLRYLVSLSVLIDLSQQGWIFVVNGEDLTLKMDIDNVDDKQRIRYRLSAERNAQFKTESVRNFIKYMETIRAYNGQQISIKCLIGDTQSLIAAIKGKQRICEPYIQLVTNQRDQLTGYKLSDIWRYFRYTWSIPYKTMPGRNLFYLVRDRLQPHHPIMGIFALGNSVLNLTVRDDDIGWTVEAIKMNMQLRTSVSVCEQIVSETDGKTVKVKINKPIETEEGYKLRTAEYSNKILPLLQSSIDSAINDIYVKDLGYYRQTKKPKQELIDTLYTMAAEYAEKSINNKNNEKSPNWEEEAQSNLFKRKRSTELAKLLSTKLIFLSTSGANNFEKLNHLLSKEDGRRAIHTALIANRKCKIGSNMMDIIVCGAIPPYNELLGGKLTSILACSPVVVGDYTRRYAGQASEIASRMKGEKVVRNSQLVYLGTTSLYSVGSSQYNRIKVPMGESMFIEFRRMGITEGFGTVYFSKKTASLFSKLLEVQDGGKRINHVFGEGTSPRFRMISRGFSSIGIRADAFLRHYSPRIVYSINLAKNTNEFLMGIDNTADYGFDISDEQIIQQKTQALIEFWYQRWLTTRLTAVDICNRLESFNIKDVLLGNI